MIVDEQNLDSTPSLDILVVPIRFVVNINKLPFPRKNIKKFLKMVESLSWKFEGESSNVPVA